eukprot:ANDGO_05941.mRNA.1 Putative zinc finger matrin-type protein snu-23
MGPPKGVDLTNRRKFRVEDFESVNVKPNEAFSTSFASASVKYSSLKGRVDPLDLESNVGKSLLVDASAPVHKQGGYFCAVCNTSTKDSASWLDHLNGRKHLQNLGMSRKVEHSSVDEVALKLSGPKQHGPARPSLQCMTKQDHAELSPPPSSTAGDGDGDGDGERPRKLPKRSSGDGRIGKSAAVAVHEDASDDQMMAQFGFGGFGSSRKS